MNCQACFPNHTNVEMTKRLLYLIAGLLFFQSLSAQKEKDSLFMQFHLQFGEEALQLGKNYVTGNKDTLQISALRFYISNIRFQYADKSTSTPSGSYHLLDAERKVSLLIPVRCIKDKTISKIIFNIGVDSTASTSGAQSGDLDPVNGMYWAWQSGYINMKIEGTSPSCKTHKNHFQFHIGGYLQPNYAMREIALVPETKQLDVAVDVARFFDTIRLSDTHSVMIPGTKAMVMATASVKMFRML